MRLQEYKKNIVPNTFAYNPHELVRLLEVFDILTVSQIIIHSSLARKVSSKALCFKRGDTDLKDEVENKRLITIKQFNNKIVLDELPLDFFGDLKTNYKKYNQDYLGGTKNED